MTIRPALLALLLAAASPVASAAHAVRFPLEVDPQRAGAWRIDLPLAVYREAAHGDLRDVEARNGRGEPVPLGPVPLRYGAPAASALETVSLTPFALPPLGGTAPSGAQLRLLVERDAGGTLRRLDLSESGAPAAPAGAELLFDAGSGEASLHALDVALDPAGGPAQRARVVVLASDDLDTWRPLGPSQALLRIEQAGRLLERRTLDLGGQRARYLLLRGADGAALPPVAQVALRLRHQPPLVADWPQSQSIDAAFVRGGAAGEFIYRAPGAIPVDGLEVVPADLNSVAEVVVESRAADDRPWVRRQSGTVFRVAIDGEESGSLPVRIDAVREREWRITTDPPLAQPPVLRLSFTPDTWVLLAQGPGPFELRAGSAESRRADWPLERALDAMAAQSGPGFRLPLATVGEAVQLDGVAALTPAPTPPPWWRIALWGVLLLGALAVVVLVLRLLRERAPA
ncbi:MAG: DUF3999 domain-containing protein [Xanthomonadaceae bacterium]|nr:DUF3999 domain-containing protein [Xanthomonadaceae bacterium]